MDNQITISDYCQQLLAHLGVEDGQVEVQEETDRVFVHISVPEQESGILIGYHGETIASLQRIFIATFRSQLQDKKVVVNINDYKQKREEVVKNMALRFANKVQETQQQQVLPYLPANERLVVHTTLKDFPGVQTYSEGEGMQRRLIVAPTSEMAA